MFPLAVQLWHCQWKVYFWLFGFGIRTFGARTVYGRLRCAAFAQAPLVFLSLPAGLGTALELNWRERF
jgi:hypothetical protein